MNSFHIAKEYADKILKFCCTPYTFPDGVSSCPSKVVVQSHWMRWDCKDLLVVESGSLNDISNKNYDAFHADIVKILRKCLDWASQYSGEIDGVQGMLAEDLPLAQRLFKYEHNNTINSEDVNIIWKGHLLLALLSLSEFKSLADSSFSTEQELDDIGGNLTRSYSMIDALEHYNDAQLAYGIAERVIFEYASDSELKEFKNKRRKSLENLSNGPRAISLKFNEEYRSFGLKIRDALGENAKLKEKNARRATSKKYVIRRVMVEQRDISFEEANANLENEVARYNRWDKKNPK